MRSWRFLLSRRWIIFAIVVALLAYLAWWLGEWQFGRLEDRKASNAVVERNEHLAPAPVDEVLARGRAVPDEQQWRVVQARGEYLPEQTVVIRYRTREGESGVDIAVPFKVAAGEVLIVDRGWMPTENSGASAEDVTGIPAPPDGTVTITGWVRQDDTGDHTAVTDRSTRSVNSEEIGRALDLTTYGGFVELKSEQPAPAKALEPVELPELNNGPHFFYGLQWWFFGLLAIIGFGYLAWDERRGGPQTRAAKHAAVEAEGARARARSQSAQHPTVDREHHAGHES